MQWHVPVAVVAIIQRNGEFGRGAAVRSESSAVAEAPQCRVLRNPSLHFLCAVRPLNPRCLSPATGEKLSLPGWSATSPTSIWRMTCHVNSDATSGRPGCIDACHQKSSEQAHGRVGRSPIRLRVQCAPARSVGGRSLVIRALLQHAMRRWCTVVLKALTAWGVPTPSVKLGAGWSDCGLLQGRCRGLNRQC